MKMHNIKITKVEFVNITYTVFGILYNYLLHRDDDGKPFPMCVNHYMQDAKQRAEHIEFDLNYLQRNLQGGYGRITNLFEIMDEIKTLDENLP